MNSASIVVPPEANTWIEISESAIKKNASVFRDLAGKDKILTAVVKANAYGHGLIPISKAVLSAGVNWLAVFSVTEGVKLREAGINAPVLVLGPTPKALIKKAAHYKLKLTVASFAVAKEIAVHPSRFQISVHLKVETGTNRQGLLQSELNEACNLLATAQVPIEGIYSHFADIEDTTNHVFAQKQLKKFNVILASLRNQGHKLLVPHAACTAATILFPDTYFSMVRVGVGMYGLWPSKETRVSAGSLARNRLGLQPVMTWKTRIAQIKTVPVKEFVGYGRTFRATRTTQVAVLPVGYSDGYDRSLSNSAYTLVRGTRAPVIGRVCMNFTMIDVTDVPDVLPNDEVVLLGQQGEEQLFAEDLAELSGTINYEIVTRAAPGAPRILV